MRISFASCWLLVLLTVVATAKAERSLANVSGRAKVDAKEENVDRRCAYLGRWGSFHLIGNGGSGAYQLGRDRYVADLTFASEDKSFWYYRPGNGDQATSLWAFERKLNCGCSWVWRKDGNGWHRYEFARAWGSGFGESIKRAAESTLSLEGLDSRLEQLEGRVDKLDGGKSFP